MPKNGSDMTITPSKAQTTQELHSGIENENSNADNRKMHRMELSARCNLKYFSTDQFVFLVPPPSADKPNKQIPEEGQPK